MCITCRATNCDVLRPGEGGGCPGDLSHWLDWCGGDFTSDSSASGAQTFYQNTQNLISKKHFKSYRNKTITELKLEIKIFFLIECIPS